MGVSFRWSDCCLEREARSLTRSGREVRIQPLVLDLLLLLLQHRGRVVAPEVLERELWRGVKVTESSLRRLVKEARRAIGDDGGRQAQIQTVRGRGLRFAAPVAVEGGWDTSFVGRDDLLAALEEALEAAHAGVGSVTLLYGAAGIGKTRLLGELGARAGARGMRVLSGSGRAGAEGDAFHPWLEAMGELGLDELLRAPRPVHGTTADARRFAQFRDVAQALVRASREQPLVVTLDDLQFADADSLALLRYVAPSVHAARVLLLGSFRSSAPVASSGRLSELAALGAETASQVHALRGLAPDELQTVVRNRLQVELDGPTAALLSTRTEGNPLFALEIARSVQAEGGSFARLAPKLTTGIEPLLERRLAALAPDSRRILCAASAIGSEFEPSLVQEAEACEASLVARALDDATAVGLLEPALGEKRRFAHALFAEALYAQLTALPGGAAAQHLRIAEALEKRGTSDPFQLARHFDVSRPLVSAARALVHVRAAAEAASRRAALADTELWLRRALGLAEEAGVPAGELVRLLLELGEVVVATSGLTEARPLLERAAQLAEATGDGTLLARAALAYAQRPLALWAEKPVLRWLRSAEAVPDLELPLRARVASRLGAELAFAGPAHRAEARRRLDQGLALARRGADSHTLGRVLLDQTALQFSAADTRAYLERMDEIVQNAEIARDPEPEFRARVGRTAARLELGDRDGADEALRSCQRMANEYASLYSVNVTRLAEATFALLDGRLADARAAIEAARTLVRGRGLPGLLMVSRFLLACQEGGLPELLPAIESLGPRYAGGSTLGSMVALIHANAGAIEPARLELVEFVQHLPDFRFDWQRLPALVMAAEAAFRARLPDVADVLEPELAPYAHLGAVAPNATGYFGSVAQALGWLAAARGRKREALTQFRRAHRVHESLRSPVWCARSLRAIEEVQGGASKRAAPRQRLRRRARRT